MDLAGSQDLGSQLLQLQLLLLLLQLLLQLLLWLLLRLLLLLAGFLLLQLLLYKFMLLSCLGSRAGVIDKSGLEHRGNITAIGRDTAEL